MQKISEPGAPSPALIFYPPRAFDPKTEPIFIHINLSHLSKIIIRSLLQGPLKWYFQGGSRFLTSSFSCLACLVLPVPNSGSSFSDKKEGIYIFDNLFQKRLFLHFITTVGLPTTQRWCIAETTPPPPHPPNVFSHTHGDRRQGWSWQAFLAEFLLKRPTELPNSELAKHVARFLLVSGHCCVCWTRKSDVVPIPIFDTHTTHNCYSKKVTLRREGPQPHHTPHILKNHPLLKLSLRYPQVPHTHSQHNHNYASNTSIQLCQYVVSKFLIMKTTISESRTNTTLYIIYKCKYYLVVKTKYFFCELTKYRIQRSNTISCQWGPTKFHHKVILKISFSKLIILHHRISTWEKKKKFCELHEPFLQLM